MAKFKMPSVEADMETGVLCDWRVKPGDRVQRGDIIAAVETDKDVIDIEVFEDGVVQKLLIAEGERVPVGTVIALIGAEEPGQTAAAQPEIEGEQTVAEPPAAAAHLPPLAKAASDVSCTEAHPTDQQALLRPDGIRPPSTNGRRVKVSPAVRRLVEDLLLDVGAIEGTGRNGTILRADVEQAARARAAAKPAPAKAPPLPITTKPPTPAKVVFQTGMRRAIAAAMARSNRDIPHYYLETQIDMTGTLHWLEAENLRGSLKDRLLPEVLLIKATALALSEVPGMNGFWREDEFQPSEAIHVGFAIALRPEGLVTPAIHHADLKSLDELMATMRDLITRARSGRLRTSELTDATVTLTSLGDRGVEKVFGVIFPPQVALVGFGKIAERPWAENGLLGVRQILTATLAADHRASDTHRGGLFLDALANYLKDPKKL